MNEKLIKLNELLKRYEKAVKYMDCYELEGKELDAVIVECEKWVDNLRTLINEIGLLWHELKL